MFEAAVGGVDVGHFGCAELFEAAEALHVWCVYYFACEGTYVDAFVYVIVGSSVSEACFEASMGGGDGRGVVWVL